MRPRIWVPIVVVLVVLVAFLGAYAADSAANSGNVARGVTLRGEDVGGLTPAELRARVETLAADYAQAAVDLDTPNGRLETNAAALGLALDVEATVAGALAVDADTGAVAGPFVWAGSMAGNRAAPLVFTDDQAILEAGAAPLLTANHVDPTEPSVADDGSALVTIAGHDGADLDVPALTDALVRTAATGATPITVVADPVPVAPRFTLADAEVVAAKGTALASTPLVLDVGGKSATIAPPTLRSWMTSIPGPANLELHIDEAELATDLQGLVGDLGTAPVQLSFTIVRDEATGQDRPEIVDGVPGTTCCAPDSVQRVLTALEAGQTTVALDLLPVPPDHDRAWAESLGITEPIATFTTNHAGGEARVTNIHRFADLIRGTVVEPGGLLSLNEAVGQRTTEKGFVEAGVIYDGVYDSDVGGGVSQFATTTFNTAFFAGLDFEEYQSHSLVISRYPYGREATISWPKPDLKIRNNTPYGILVWPTYTDTSITVTFWSTPWITGEQTGQTETPGENCKTVRTERTRTWLVDGHTETDTVIARYQNREGVNCL